MKRAKLANELKKLNKQSETASRILSMVAERQRNTAYTAFSGLRADLKKRDQKPVDRTDFDATFDHLESIGAGKINKTHRGTYKGFMWSIPVRSLGEILSTPVEEEPEDQIKAAPEKKPVTVILLRKNRAPQAIEADESQLTSLMMK